MKFEGRKRVQLKAGQELIGSLFRTSNGEVLARDLLLYICGFRDPYRAQCKNVVVNWLLLT